MDANGDVAARERVATPRGDYRATIDAIAHIVARLDVEGVLSVGCGTPGAWRPGARRMKNCNSTWLNDRPLLDDLIAVLGPRVRVANDADCFALSEATDGAARGVAVVFGVIMGTGVGGGVVAHGRLLQGPNALSGEWGHNPLPPVRSDRDAPEAVLEAQLGDRDCYCGRTNCVETFLSGPGIARSATELFGESRPLPDLLAADDTSARSLQNLCAGQLARALAVVVNVLDPDVVVIGGGVSGSDALLEGARERLVHHAFNSEGATRLVAAAHGATSGVRGAAWLWRHGELNDGASRDGGMSELE